MATSRLERVRNRKAGKQGLTYLVVTIVLILITIFWGLPAIARLTGLMIKTDSTIKLGEVELRPTPPIFSDIPEATFSGKTRIAGFAQPGLDVILFINEAEYDRKLVSESGTFTFDDVMLVEGDNEAYAYSATLKDMRSERSKNYKIMVDLTKPVVTINAPKDGGVFRGQSQRITTINGSVSELGSKVFIGDRMAIVSPDNKFSLTYQLVEGDQDMQIKAIDKAGNENMSSLKLRWEP